MGWSWTLRWTLGLIPTDAASGVATHLPHIKPSGVSWAQSWLTCRWHAGIIMLRLHFNLSTSPTAVTPTGSAGFTLCGDKHQLSERVSSQVHGNQMLLLLLSIWFLPRCWTANYSKQSLQNLKYEFKEEFHIDNTTAVANASQSFRVWTKGSEVNWVFWIQKKQLTGRTFQTSSGRVETQRHMEPWRRDVTL